MSFKVLIVPEDPTHNGAILKPLISRMLRACRRPRADVTVLTNPTVRGFEHAKSVLTDRVLELYGHLDLLLFLPDADCKDRSGVFERLEAAATSKSATLICCAAKEEIEAWLLAGHVDRLSKPWREIRRDCLVKENVFEPFLREYGDSSRPDGGRDLLMQETLKNYDGLLRRCPELRELQNRIREMFPS